MLFLFLTTIGVSLVLQHKIRQEYDGEPSFLEKRRAISKIEERFAFENSQLDGDLKDLLGQHRARVARRDSSSVSDNLYQEAMEELERDLSRDPLAEAFDDLEKGYDKKKKTGL